jgi:enoyl-CoA hydratase
VFDHPRPVVAAVNGHALAGGCVLAAAREELTALPGASSLADQRRRADRPVADLPGGRRRVEQGGE